MSEQATQQLLSGIGNYIDVSSDLTQKQQFVLAMSEEIVSSAMYEEDDLLVSKTIKENVQFLRAHLASLPIPSSHKLFISKVYEADQTEEPSERELLGVDYSYNDRCYYAHVRGPKPWLLLKGHQLVLREVPKPNRGEQA